jgi:hypothetical protein
LTYKILVEPLRAEDGQVFLLDLLASNGEVVASEEQKQAPMAIFTYTGDLPLALTVVAQYCYTGQLSLSEVNQQLLCRQTDLFDLPSGLRVLTCTIQELAPSARQLIKIISLLTVSPKLFS